MKKIIFLDFDGVLQIDQYQNPWTGNTTLMNGYTDRDKYGLLFDHDCVKNLSSLLRVTQAFVVITSSWRYEGWDCMWEMWQERKMPGTIIGMTATDEDAGSRGKQVTDWLMKNPCKQFVILDDVDDFLDSQKDHLVLTDERFGFQKEALDRAVAILGE